MGQQLSWLEHTTDNREVDGSSPFWPTTSNPERLIEAFLKKECFTESLEDSKMHIEN